MNTVSVSRGLNHWDVSDVSRINLDEHLGVKQQLEFTKFWFIKVAQRINNVKTSIRDIRVTQKKRINLFSKETSF